MSEHLTRHYTGRREPGPAWPARVGAGEVGRVGGEGRADDAGEFQSRCATRSRFR